MIKSQLNPGTMDFYSDAHNVQYGGMRTSNFGKEDLQRMPGFPNQMMGQPGHEMDETYHRRNMTHRPGDFRKQDPYGRRNQRGFVAKNSSMSMHNLNNFGYLKESGSIKVAKNQEHPSIFR